MFDPNQPPPLPGQMQITSQPALSSSQDRWREFFAMQGRQMPTMQQRPQVPPMVAQPQASAPPGGLMGVLYKAAQAKFGKGMATPLADRVGWSASWGSRPTNPPPQVNPQASGPGSAWLRMARRGQQNLPPMQGNPIAAREPMQAPRGMFARPPVGSLGVNR